MSSLRGSTRNLWILAFTLVVVMLGYGMVIPIIPFYAEQMGAGGRELGLLVASYALMRLVCGPAWGAVSDRWGRKPVLMIGVLGYAVTMFFFGLATELWMLFAARVLSGILSSATGPTTLAYIADSTSEEQRSSGMGLLGAAVGVGTILGPALGGLLSGRSLAVPFFIAAGLSLLAVVLIFLILPESLKAEQRTDTASSLAVLRPGVIWAAVKSPVGVLFGLAMLITAGVTAFYGIFGLYALDRYGYGPEQVGLLMMVMGFVSAVGQGALSGPLARRFGDVVVLRAALLLSVPAYLLMIPAGNLWSLALTMGLFILVTAVMVPPLTALTSRLTTLDQGLTMGLSNSFMSLGRIIGPAAGGYAFDLHLLAPFWVGAALLLGGFALSLRPFARRLASGVPEPSAGGP